MPQLTFVSPSDHNSFETMSDRSALDDHVVTDAKVLRRQFRPGLNPDNFNIIVKMKIEAFSYGPGH